MSKILKRIKLLFLTMSIVFFISSAFSLSVQVDDPKTARSDSVAVEDFKPASSNQPGQEYPQVNSQGYARFRIAASQAQNVTINISERK